MSVLRTDLPRRELALQPNRSAVATPRRRKVLAVIDGSARSADVLDYLVETNEHSKQEVVLLNVQPQPEDWRLRGYGSFKRDEIRDRLINDRGLPVVTSAASRLERAGIAHKERVEIGDPAETIERCAREEGCDEIVVAEQRSGSLRSWLAKQAGIAIGSLLCQLLEVTDRPLIVVR
jgi:nucleotide-binding universal stress UspA family protein